MTASALKHLTTLANLRATWADFWRASSRQRSSGVDGITPANFHRHLERNLARLHHELRDGYTFSPLRGHPVPKNDGRTYRIICVPTVTDRIVQRLIARHLSERAHKFGIINEASFGFMPSETSGTRRGVRAARDRAKELRSRHKWAYKSDISSFFDRIPRPELVHRTVSALRTPSLEPLLRAAVACEIDDSDPAVARIAERNGIIRGLGVRQGMPLSPIFSNIILRDFDTVMLSRGYKLVRYADDFIVLADSQQQCLEIDAVAREVLSRLDLELPPLGTSKTRLADPATEIDFLGLALSPAENGEYQLVITDAQLQKITKSLGQMKDVDQLLRNGIDITGLTRRIDNAVAGYLAAYNGAQNTEELRSVLARVRTDILRSVFVRAFGEQKQPVLAPRTTCCTTKQNASSLTMMLIVCISSRVERWSTGSAY